MQVVSQVAVRGDLLRRLGFSYELTITNNSGKDAWIYLAPHKICTFKGISIEKIGSIELDINFTPRVQKISIPNAQSKNLMLDTNDVYYSVFFDFKDGVYKSNAQDILFNTRKYNLVLLPRHVNASRTVELNKSCQ